jgi:translation initiation factor 3 subunit I
MNTSLHYSLKWVLLIINGIDDDALLLLQIVLGGGQEAIEVTTTSTRQGKFEARFYHVVFEEEFARVKGHFGPINSVAFHPDGRSYSSGAEDGYVRIQSFDESYFKFKFDF